MDRGVDRQPDHGYRTSHVQYRRYIQIAGLRGPSRGKEQRMRFAKRVVLITGAGSGIGRTSALTFAREGAFVVAADLDQASAAATVAEMESGQGLALAGDVAKPED